jgi:hypothetical protein
MFKVTIGGSVLVDHDHNNELGVGFLPNVLGSDEEERAVPIWVGAMTDHRPMNPNDLGYDYLMGLYRESVRGAALSMDRITGGELKAHIEMRDEKDGGIDSTKRGIPYYIEMINNLARVLVVQINEQHVQGWTDNPNGSTTGVRFFNDNIDGLEVGRVVLMVYQLPEMIL